MNPAITLFGGPIVGHMQVCESLGRYGAEGLRQLVQSVFDLLRRPRRARRAYPHADTAIHAVARWAVRSAGPCFNIAGPKVLLARRAHRCRWLRPSATRAYNLECPPHRYSFSVEVWRIRWLGCPAILICGQVNDPLVRAGFRRHQRAAN